MIFLAVIRLDDTRSAFRLIAWNEDLKIRVMPKDIRIDPLPQGPHITGQATQLNPPTLKTPDLPQVSSTNFSGSGLLGSAVGVIGNLIGDQVNYNRQKKMYETQRQDALSDYERQRSDYLSDLASERAYNSPAAQRARLLEAGINPNVAFGNGNVANTSSDAQAMPNTRSSVFPSVSLGRDLGSGIMASGLDMVRARDLDSQMQLRHAEMLKTLSETSGIDQRTKAQAIENGWLDFMFESEVNQRFQMISESLSRQNSMAISDAQEIFKLHNILPAEQQKIIASTRQLYASIDQINEDVRFLRSTHSDRVKSVEYKKLLDAYNSEIAEFERDIKSTHAPKDAVDSWLQGVVHRLKLVRESIISFGSK